MKVLFEKRHIQFILSELYNKICNCLRDKNEEDLLNPAFHEEECLYRLAVEKENIQWNKEIPTQSS